MNKKMKELTDKIRGLEDNIESLVSAHNSTQNKIKKLQDEVDKLQFIEKHSRKHIGFFMCEPNEFIYDKYLDSKSMKRKEVYLGMAKIIDEKLVRNDKLYLFENIGDYNITSQKPIYETTLKSRKKHIGYEVKIERKIWKSEDWCNTTREKSNITIITDTKGEIKNMSLEKMI